MLRILRFLTLLLTGLALTMTSAHVLEMPQKLQYDPALYTTVNATLYRYFALVGSAYTVGALVASVLLTVAVRNRRSAFAWTACGAFLLLVAFASWLILVNPVNLRIAQAMAADPRAVPKLWMLLRVRWESGHLLGFFLQLAGFAALVISVLVDTPRQTSPSTGRVAWR
jgi:hypothetical protein